MSCKPVAKFLKFKEHSVIVRTHCKEKVAKNPSTNRPYIVWFVNNTVASPGSGTFESPFATLASAAASSGPYDIIYVYYGDGTDNNQNSGIVLKTGQQLLSSGYEQQLKLCSGFVVIPAQDPAGSQPTISNTNVTDNTGLTAVRLLNGNNVVSGFSLVDTQGVVVEFTPPIIEISSALQIDSNKNYTVKNNTLSTPSFEAASANALNILGGGSIKIKRNQFFCGNTNDVFGVYITNATSLLEGDIELKRNVFAGQNGNSGFVTGIHYDSSNNGAGLFVQTDSSVTILGNIFASQSNTTPFDYGSAILFNAASALGSTLTYTVAGNLLTLPSDSPTALSELAIFAFGQGTVSAKVYDNVASNSLGLPDYLFVNATNLYPPFLPNAIEVCFVNNVGTRQDIIIPAASDFSGRFSAAKGQYTGYQTRLQIKDLN